MVREINQTRSFRLSETVYKEIEKIIEEDKIRSANNLFEQFILSYREVQNTSYKKTKKESDYLSKELSTIKKDLSALIYLNGNMGEFFSLPDIKDLDNNNLVKQSREKVKRDIETNQVKKSFKNN